MNKKKLYQRDTVCICRQHRLGRIRRMLPVSFYGIRSGLRMAHRCPHGAFGHSAAHHRNSRRGQRHTQDLDIPLRHHVASGLRTAWAADVPVYVPGGCEIFQLCHCHSATESERYHNGSARGSKESQTHERRADSCGLSGSGRYISDRDRRQSGKHGSLRRRAYFRYPCSRRRRHIHAAIAPHHIHSQQSACDGLGHAYRRCSPLSGFQGVGHT